MEACIMYMMATWKCSVQLGKIGGRLRRQAICLLAVVLDPIGEEAPALNKLLEQLPKVCSI